MRLYGQETQLNMLGFAVNILLNLSGETGGRFDTLRNELAEEFTDLLGESYSLIMMYSEVVINFMFGYYEEAYQYTLRCMSILRRARSGGDVSTPHLFMGLSLLAYIQMKELKVRHRRSLVKTIRYCLTRLQGWSYYVPDNFSGMFHLLLAEFDWVLGDVKKAYSSYRISVTMSTEGRLILTKAIALERLGKFMLAQKEYHNDITEAKGHIVEALSNYRYLEFYAKADHLQKELSQLC